MKTQLIFNNPKSYILRAWPLIVLSLVLLFALATPIISLLIKSTYFDLPFSGQIIQSKCQTNTPCVEILQPKGPGYWERDNSGYRLPMRFTNVNDLFEVADWIKSGQLTVDAPNDRSISLIPKYRMYENGAELRRFLDVDLYIPHEPPKDLTISFNFLHSPLWSATIKTQQAPIHLSDSTRQIVDHLSFRLILLASLIFLSSITILADAFFAAKLCDNGGLLASTVVGRMVILATLFEAGPLLAAILAAVALVVPIIPLPYLFYGKQIRAWLSNFPSSQKLNFEPTLHEQRLWTGVALIALTIFGFAMFYVQSFRWSIFEERDLLEAIDVITRWPQLPVYGPELLAGGHTPGGGLYLLLAPLVKIFPTADALHFLNIALFFGSAILVWCIVRSVSGLFAASFALVAFVASERIIALSYWPIHPNFSIFFSLFYFLALMRGVMRSSSGWLIVSGFILGFLAQLHISFLLLLPAHVMIMFIRNNRIGILVRVCSVMAFLFPFVPYFIVEFTNEFQNFVQILQQPRFHPAYVRGIALANERIVPLSLGWLDSLTLPLTVIVMSLLAIGIANSLFRIIKQDNDQKMVPTPPVIALIFLCVPLLILTFLGLGYNSRHTLALVPALFVLVGLGAAVLVRSFRKSHWIPTTILLTMITSMAFQLGSNKFLERIAPGEWEWTVDFKDRQTIQRHLIETIRLTPQLYGQKVIWMWLGWSIDPTIYARAYETQFDKTKQVSTNPIGNYWLITESKDLWPYLDNLFITEAAELVGSMYIHSARLRPEYADISVSGNADTGVRLGEFLNGIDKYRAPSEGFQSVVEVKIRNQTATAYLGSILGNHFKVLITIIKERQGDNLSIKWCVDSPTLNGHYQEIKTIWQPKLVARNEHGKELFAVPLARNVLGNLLYKTPRCGTNTISASDEPKFSFLYSGIFDQSFMSTPSIEIKDWPISETTAMENLSLKKSGEIWLNNRLMNEGSLFK